MDATNNMHYWLYFLLWSVPFTLFAVNCHRVFLIGSMSIPEFGYKSFSKREIQFYIWTNILSLLLIGLIVVCAWLLSVIFNWLNTSNILWLSLVGISYSLVFYAFSRLSLILPAIATEGNTRLESVWQLSKGHGAHITIIVGFVPVLLSSWTYLLLGKSFVIDVLLILIGYGLYAVEIAVLSLAYRYLNPSMVEAPASHQHDKPSE
jgi:hypothetical protein